MPGHRELDPDKLFRKIYPYVSGEGKQLQDYWDAGVISAAVVRNSLLGEGLEHPVPFPEDFVRLPILMATEEGDLALDPFVGSGTTGRVSNAHKRFFVGKISSNTLGTTGLYTDSQPSRPYVADIACPFLIRLFSREVPIQQVRRDVELVVAIRRDLVFAGPYDRYAVLTHQPAYTAVPDIQADLLQLFRHQWPTIAS